MIQAFSISQTTAGETWVDGKKWMWRKSECVVLGHFISHELPFVVICFQTQEVKGMHDVVLSPQSSRYANERELLHLRFLPVNLTVILWLGGVSNLKCVFCNSWLRQEEGFSSWREMYGCMPRFVDSCENEFKFK